MKLEIISCKTRFLRRWNYNKASYSEIYYEKNEIESIVSKNKEVPAIGAYYPQNLNYLPIAFLRFTNTVLNGKMGFYFEKIGDSNTKSRDYLEAINSLPRIKNKYNPYPPLCHGISYREFKIVQETLNINPLKDWLILIPEYRYNSPEVFRLGISYKYDAKGYYKKFRANYKPKGKEFGNYVVIYCKSNLHKDKAKKVGELIKEDYGLNSSNIQINPNNSYEIIIKLF